MSTPKASDLFMAIWNREMWAENTTLPGSKEWQDKNVQKHWMKVWNDCTELSRMLVEQDKFVGNVVDFVQNASCSRALEEQVQKTED